MMVILASEVLYEVELKWLDRNASLWVEGVIFITGMDEMGLEDGTCRIQMGLELLVEVMRNRFTHIISTK